jgi:hypothetical protein
LRGSLAERLAAGFVRSRLPNKQMQTDRPSGAEHRFGGSIATSDKET